MNLTGQSGRVSAAVVQQRVRRLRLAPARLRDRVCRASNILLRSGVVAWAGAASVRDYAQDHLGVPSGRFRTWAEVGDLLESIPAVRDGYLTGGCSFSVAAELARARRVLDVESLVPWLPGLRVEDVRALAQHARAELPGGDARRPHSSPVDADGTSADPDFRRITLHAPAEGAGYAWDTAALAEALLGASLPEEDAWDAVVAEASTEVDFTVSAVDACRLYGMEPEELSDPALARAVAAASSTTTAAVPDATPSAQGTATPAPPDSLRATSSAQPAEPRFALHGRDRLRRADAILRRLIARLQELDVRLEDELLALYLEDAHVALGYRRFEDFAVEQLELSPRTIWSRISSARRRRLEDPLALAQARGQLSRVQITILEELRRLHVPASAHAAWITAARDDTTRRLRAMVGWARGQVEQDYRSFALAGFPPPTDEQLQISARSIEGLAKNPEPPSIRQLESAPLVPLRLRVRRDSLILLLQVMASLQQQHERRTGVRPPAWWAFLRICYLARKAWARQDPERRPDNHAIHDRDGWRCAIPICSNRRGLEAHHIVFRSNGGGDEPENLITLCSFHHRPGVHQKTVRVLGRATHGRHSLRFELCFDEQGRPGRVYHGERRDR